MKIKEHWQIVIALAAAALLGLLLGMDSLRDTAVVSGFVGISEFLGDIFLRLLKMVIVPLIVSAVVSGIASLGGVEGFGRMGLKTLLYYMFTSFVAICVGLMVVNVFRPGEVGGEPSPLVREMIDRKADEMAASPDEKIAGAKERAEAGARGLVEILRDLVPPNIIKAASDGQMLGLIFFSIVFGAALTRMPGESGDVMRHFFQALNDLMVAITRGIMMFAPIGVFFLILPVIVDVGIGFLGALWKYFLVVLLALGLHLFVVMPILLMAFARVDPRRHYSAMKEALLTAFSTSSSSATLPVTMRCVRDNAGVSKKVTSFVLPLGATVNMDGTALYECVVVIFLAQVMGYDMTLTEQFAVVLLALWTSIGVAGVPQASLVAILIILNAAKIPGLNPDAAMAVVLTVDRLLDMSRTAVNIFSDSCGAVVIAKSEGEKGVLANP